MPDNDASRKKFRREELFYWCRIWSQNDARHSGGGSDKGSEVAAHDGWQRQGSSTDMNEHETRSAAGKPRRDDPLGANSEIGRKLREYYDGLVTPDVPDRFTDLLSQLETAESQRKKAGDAE